MWKNLYFDENCSKYVLRVYYYCDGDTAELIEKDSWAEAAVGQSRSWSGCGAGLRDMGFLFDTAKELDEARSRLAEYSCFFFNPADTISEEECECSSPMLKCLNYCVFTGNAIPPGSSNCPWCGGNLGEA